MKRLLYAVTITAMVAILTASVTPPAHACTCGSVPLEEQVARADLIFDGRVTAVEYDPPLAAHTDRSQPFVILQVERYLKGSASSYVRMRDPGYVVDAVLNGEPMRFATLGCSVFETEPVGKRFLVVTRGVEQPINTDYCAGSIELRDYGTPEAVAYLASVEQILAPDSVPPTGGPPSTSNDAAFPAVAAAIGSLLVLAGAAFVWRPATDRHRMRNE